ncbi:hypothetical protein AVDCRST_MAG81-1827 [uncultured Synechococcales cyanobacterium]|uniref:Uncharacterized protein n=1 Tax=uncultured Synechococcales cyanobacterium TaxID=1936017 RepID=A0A6J4UIL9_9CYAN|nr:hypothetical protein AVDCRST_MAG81-1827 [uncultured Synechococcales cyanobacterium]
MQGCKDNCGFSSLVLQTLPVAEGKIQALSASRARKCQALPHPLSVFRRIEFIHFDE